MIHPKSDKSKTLQKLWTAPLNRKDKLCRNWCICRCWLTKVVKNILWYFRRPQTVRLIEMVANNSLGNKRVEIYKAFIENLFQSYKELERSISHLDFFSFHESCGASSDERSERVCRDTSSVGKHYRSQWTLLLFAHEYWRYTERFPVWFTADKQNKQKQMVRTFYIKINVIY